MHHPIPALLALLLLAGTAHAEHLAITAVPAVYADECGSCHVAYPAELLDTAGWRRIVDGLTHHFGVDASPNPKPRAAIAAYLAQRAGRGRPFASSQAQPRLSTTAWFRFEHGAISPAGIAFADCAACHVRADQGDYREGSLKLPPGYHHSEGD
jgi:hypothetical protein